MAKFEHKYAALTLQDAKGVWAQFAPAERMVDGREQRYGVLETDDDKLIERLRGLDDPDLREVAEPKKPAQTETGVPTGSAKDLLAWVGEDTHRAVEALTAERAKGDDARTTVVAALTKLVDQQ